MEPATPSASPPGTRAPDERAAVLEEEAQRLARYLLGEETTPEIARRYAAALGKIAGERSSARSGAERGNQNRTERGARVAAFALRNPRALPFLDAAASFLEPQGLLRRKLLLMLALLETSPEHVGRFRIAERSRLAVTGRVIARGIASALELTVGLVLYPIASRRS